jgi:hypothetical protein
VSGASTADVWWREGWADPAASAALVSGAGQVRLRVSPSADTLASVLRVLTPSPSLDFIVRDHVALTASSGQVALQSASRIYLYSTTGVLTDSVDSPGPPPSLAYVAGWYWGVTDTQVRKMPSNGPVWSGSALLPDWGGHDGISIAAGAGDLFVIHHTVQPPQTDHAWLHRLDDDALNSTPSFSNAVRDSTLLQRWDLTEGTGTGFAYWADERVLAALGLNDSVWGIVTFSVAGHFEQFIPLPFEEAGGAQFAFVGPYLFIGRARPTLAALGWTHAHQPTPPLGDMVYRWPAP